MFLKTDEFRTEALYFKEFGVFTKLPVGSKQWKDYWDEQRRRCLVGHKREGGDWITGYHYNFLNFSPILQTEVIKESEDDLGQNQAIRVKDFAKFLDGQYDMFHYFEEAELSGEHAFMLGSRGRGKSLMTASMCVRNYHHIRDSKSFCFAANKDYLLKDGIISKSWDLMNFIDSHTPWAKRRQEFNDKLHRRASTKVTTASGIETIDPRSYNSEIIGTTVGDDIHKLRGPRGKLIVLEEVGNFPKLNTGWNIMRPSMEAGRNTFGLLLGIGTGGEEGANFAGAEQIFKNPKAYRVHAVTNKWDKGLQHSECAFFYPAYQNYEGAMDKDGNSDIEKAIKLILADRAEVAKSSDPFAMIRRCAEIPMTPQEAMMRISGTQFPILELKKQEAEIETKPHIYRNAETYARFELNRDTQRFEYKIDTEAKPIYNFPHQDNKNMPGAFIIYEHPKDNPKTGQPYFDRYVAGCLTEGEKVVTSTGLKSVENIKLEDRLINQEGDTVNITKIYQRTLENKDTYTITLSNNHRTTTFTEEHPILRATNKKTGRLDKLDSNFKFIEAKDLKVSDWVRIPNIYTKELNTNLNEFWNNSFNPHKYASKDYSVKNPLKHSEFWWLIGVWLGDGWLQKANDKIEICFNIKETIYIERCKTIVRKYLDRASNTYTKANLVKISFCSKQFHFFLEEYFGKYASGKRIPEWIKYLNKDSKKQLVKGYLASDGCIYKEPKGYYGTAFVSVNLEMLESFQDILFSLGHISRLSRLRPKGKHTFMLGYTSNTKECYQLAMGSHDTIDFARSVYDSEDIKLNRIDWNNLPILRKRPKQGCYIDNKYIYFQIKDIKKEIYNGQVFNFECDTHTYLCRGITTHNCDSYDFDESTTTSLGSMFIADLWTKRIVAEYTGRPSAKEFYETCRRGLLYYNAVANIENLNKGIFQYFDDKASGYLISEQLNIEREILSDNGNTHTTTRRGTGANPRVQAYARGLIAQYLLESTKNPDKKEELLIHKLKCLPLIKELIDWNVDGNFDRVVSMSMLMLIMNEREKYIEDGTYTIPTNYIGNDPFFNKLLPKSMQKQLTLPPKYI